MAYSYDQAYQYAKQQGSKIAYAPNDPAEVQHLTDWYAKEQAKLQRPQTFMGDDWTPPSITGNFFTDPNVLGSTWEGNQQRIYYRDGTSKLNAPYEESYGFGGLLGDITKYGSMATLAALGGYAALAPAAGAGTAAGTATGTGLMGTGAPFTLGGTYGSMGAAGLADVAGVGAGTVAGGTAATGAGLGGAYGSMGAGLIGGFTPAVVNSGLAAGAIGAGMPYAEAMAGTAAANYAPSAIAQAAGYTAPFTPNMALAPGAATAATTGLSALQKMLLAQQGINAVKGIAGGGAVPTGGYGAGNYGAGTGGGLLSGSQMPIPGYAQQQASFNLLQKPGKTWQDYAEEAKQNQKDYYGGYLA